MSDYLKAEYIKINHNNDTKFTYAVCKVVINGIPLWGEVTMCDGLLNEEMAQKKLSKDEIIVNELSKVIANELLKIDINE